MRCYLSEAVGTFALVFAGTGAMVVDEVTNGQVSHVGVALTFGLVVTALIYALGDVSGAHLNPAVTLGFAFAGRFPRWQVLPYVASQFVGAMAASATLGLLFEGTLLGVTRPHGSDAQSFVLEVILTAMLMVVILGVSTGAKEKGVMAGVAVGAVIALEAMFAGPISGASMNPVRSLAPAIATRQFDHVYIYLLAPLVGSLMAVGCHYFLQEAKPDA